MTNPDSLRFTATMPGAMRWLSQHHGSRKMVIEEDRVATFQDLDKASAELAKALLASAWGRAAASRSSFQMALIL